MTLRLRSFMIFQSHAQRRTTFLGLLWTSDQLVEETPTWEHTTLTTEKLPCSRRGANPQSQQVSSCKTYALPCATTATGHCIFTPDYFLTGRSNLDELSIYVSEFTLETKHKTETFKKFYDLKLWYFKMRFLNFFLPCLSLISSSFSQWPFELSFRIEWISYLVQYNNGKVMNYLTCTVLSGLFLMQYYTVSHCQANRRDVATS
jgi:hypothetical protein